MQQLLFGQLPPYAEFQARGGSLWQKSGSTYAKCLRGAGRHKKGSEVDWALDKTVFVEPVTFDFEARGSVATRRSLTALEARKVPDLSKLFKQVKAQLEPLGFTGVGDVYLEEDEGQGNTDITVFVGVRLQTMDGPADLRRRARELRSDVPQGLLAALGTLARAVCCNARGEDRVDPENWELANDYEFD